MQNIIKYLQNKIIIIGLVSIVFSAIFYGLSYMSSELYKTDVYCYSNVFDNVHNKPVFKSFNSLIRSGNIKQIKELTNLDEEVIAQIKQVDFFEIISNRNNYFKLSLVSSSNKFTEEYLNGVIYYYENVGINKKLIKLEYEKVKQKIKNKSSAVENIDSIYNIMNSKSNVLFESNIELAKNIILDELENEKIKLVTNKGLNVVNEPFAPKGSYFPNRRTFLVFGFILGFIFSLFFYVLKFELNNNK